MRELIAELTCGDDRRAEAAVAQLECLPQQQSRRAFAALEALSRSDKPDERWWAARATAALADSRAPALLARLLQDSDPAVRQCAALGLRLRPYQEAAPALLAALEGEDHLLARLAADALVAIGAPAVPALLEALSSGDLSTRVHAARALALISDPRAIPALFALLDENSACLDYWANEGLERMGVGMVFF